MLLGLIELKNRCVIRCFACGTQFFVDKETAENYPYATPCPKCEKFYPKGD